MPSASKETSNKGQYTYWKRDVAEGDEFLQNKPVKIENPAAEPNNLERRDSAGVSSWNKAGTWEEKDVSPAARKELEEIFIAGKAGNLADGVSVASCKVEGECQVFVVRGTPRLGYELKVKLSWKGAFDGAPVSGDLEIPALESDDPDGFEFKLKPDGNERSKAAAKVIKEQGKQVVKEAMKLLKQHFIGQ